MNIPADVLRLEREALELAARVASLEQRHAATEQQAVTQWYNPFWAGPSAAPATNFSASGTVYGCGSFGTFLGVPSCTVNIVDYATGLTTYGTTVTNASGPASTWGTFAIAGNIPAAGTYKIALVPGDPFAARFAAFAPAVVSLNLGSNTISTTTTTLANGSPTTRICTSMAYFPVAAVLQLTDSVLGSVLTPGAPLTTARQGSNAVANATYGTYPGCSAQGTYGPCGVSNNVPVTYTFGGTGCQVQFHWSGVYCPVISSPNPLTGENVPMSLISTSPVTFSGSISTVSALYVTLHTALTITVHE